MTRRLGGATPMRRYFAGLSLLLAPVFVLPVPAAPERPLTIHWDKNFLRVRGDKLAGGEIEILYLEAYCRPGSTDRDWGETVIKHSTEKLADDGSVIRLRDRLRDGVTVEHTI